MRLCDGYFFPVSFSTLPSHFEQDAASCQSKCAAPVELYYYQNPGAAVDQSVALHTQEPYTSLKTAFRYRKELVKGCSCKEAEYTPPEGEQAGQAGRHRCDDRLGSAIGAGSEVAVTRCRLGRRPWASRTSTRSAVRTPSRR